MAAPKISYVVIGKNEGRNLGECLRSIVAQQNQPSFEILYVDSGSTDDSVAIARQTPGVRVFTTDDKASSAAKARNVGWKAAQGQLVHFVDGDCALVPYWIAHALSAMADPLVAAVQGQLRERYPERSIYNRFADLDWPHGSGPTDSFGGVVLVRRSALARFGGYDETLRSGEDPELALRLLRNGCTILQLPVQMCWHDLGITNLRDYWRRNVAVGWSYAEQAARKAAGGQSILGERVIKSAVLVAAGLVFLLAAPFLPVLVLALVALAAGLDLVRIAGQERERAGSGFRSLAYALHVRFMTVPICVGGAQWLRDRRSGTTPRPGAGTPAAGSGAETNSSSARPSRTEPASV